MTDWFPVTFLTRARRQRDASWALLAQVRVSPKGSWAAALNLFGVRALTPVLTPSSMHTSPVGFCGTTNGECLQGPPVASNAARTPRARVVGPVSAESATA